MRYGTMERFADQRGLKSQAVRDFLRGTSSTAKDAVAKELGIDPVHFELSHNSTNVDAVSKARTITHRQNAEAR